MASGPHVVILYNPSKPEARAMSDEVARCVSEHAVVDDVGTLDSAHKAMDLRPDRIIVLGGDGSILAVARALGDRPIPIAGVNFGKLGYLAEFTGEELTRHLPTVLSDDSLVSARMMLTARLHDHDTSTHSLAVNDCVVHAGPPFRMIELAIAVNGDQLTDFTGDGLVVATPSGSTAHNLSVGGPIVESEIPAIVLSPISPHSLTHRPLVVHGESLIEVTALQVNDGTTVVIDGQVTFPMQKGDTLTIRRTPQPFLLIRNPTQPRWYTLTTKIRWGR